MRYNSMIKAGGNIIGRNIQPYRQVFTGTPNNKRKLPESASYIFAGMVGLGLYQMMSYHVDEKKSEEAIPNNIQTAFDKYKFAAAFTILTQVAAMPVQNLLAARNQGQSYPEAILQRLKNPADFYNGLARNTGRRLVSSVGISSFAAYVRETFDLDKYTAAMIATTIETTVSIALGEMSEKRKIIEKAVEKAGGTFSAKGYEINVKNGSIAGALAARNGLFMAAIFLVDPIVDTIYNSETLNIAGFSRDQLTKGLRFALTMASVIPENITNELVKGKSFLEIFSSKTTIASLTKGALARGLYGTIASWAIATGFKIAEKNAQKEGGLNLTEIIEISLEQFAGLVPFFSMNAHEERPMLEYAERVKDGIFRMIDAAGDLEVADVNDLAVKSMSKSCIDLLSEIRRDQGSVIDMFSPRVEAQDKTEDTQDKADEDWQEYCASRRVEIKAKDGDLPSESPKR